MAGGDELLLERQKVLDDAIVNDRELVGRVGVRVRVPVGRFAVGRPAGMADANVAGNRGDVQQCRQPVELSFCFRNPNGGAIRDRNPCRVVPTIFELA